MRRQLWIFTTHVKSTSQPFILKDDTFATRIPSSITPNPSLALLQSGEEFLSLLKCEICLDSTVSYEGLHCQTKESV